MLPGLHAGRRTLVALVVAVDLMAGAAPARAEDEIVLGMSAALSGPSQGLGIELWRGARAYFSSLNERGGIEGRPVVLRVLDDGYDPERALTNTQTLLEDEDVAALFGFVGTPTTTRILPLMKLHDMKHGGRMLLFFPFTGAQPLRHPPYGDLVFNLRASYRDETRGLVAGCSEIGRRRIGIFYQADAYGRSGWDGVHRAAARHGAEVVAEATYRRGDNLTGDYSRQVEILREANADCVIAIGTYAACAGFIRNARDAGWDVLIANVSFVGSENLLAELLELSAAGTRDYTMNLVNSQVVPDYRDESLPAVREYREAMESFAPRPEPAVSGSNYRPVPLGPVSLEGFLSAKLMAEILRRADDASSTPDLRAAAESVRTVDLGTETPVSYSANDHEGLEKVYFTTIEDGRFVPLSDWSRWRK